MIYYEILENWQNKATYSILIFEIFKMGLNEMRFLFVKLDILSNK